MGLLLARLFVGALVPCVSAGKRVRLRFHLCGATIYAVTGGDE
ncbi:MAG: hypothetical protein NT029_11630 [Armatimonadetes bacterium]|nr:hypothetical protein [Armatimonadota bacterium]